ncbi:MAG: hypothetical protein ABI317_12135 [Gaiellales bacterium]
MPLPTLAQGLAEGIRTLAPTCTVAVVAAVGSQWQQLARIGSVDIAPHWARAVAERISVTDTPEHDAGQLIAPFAAIELHALLVLAPERGEQVPARVLEAVRSMLTGGGVLLDRAIDAQRRDRLVRRVVSECRLRDGRRPRTTSELEHTLAGLWPKATAELHHGSALGNLPWNARRLIATAARDDHPAIGRTPSHDGLLPADLRNQIAVPIGNGEGAILIEVDAAGETPDTDTVATAMRIACAACESGSSLPRSTGV